jgi:hypothetical protein
VTLDDEHTDCDELLRWAEQIARVIEIGKMLTLQERAQFEQELKNGDPLARAVVDDIRRYKSGRWSTPDMQDRALARLKEHEEWKRLWKPLPGSRRQRN